MNNKFLDIFKNKTVLVTGHTGFKGSWLSLCLHNAGAKVIGYSLDPYTEKDNFVVTGIGEKITADLRKDVRDYDDLLATFGKHKPEIVFHLAAQPLVRFSYETPRETYNTNVMGTVNILEAIRNTDSVKVAVLITSDKCYDNKEWVFGYRENDPMGGYDPYSSSKGACELAISSYRNSFFNPTSFDTHKKGIASVRAGNVIGGGDFSQDRIIPDCIKALEDNKAIGVRSPDSIRPWQHVLEPLYGYLLLASKMLTEGDLYSEAWNFGPYSSHIFTVKELVEKLIHHWGNGTWEDLSDKGMNNNKHEAKLLTLDINKALYKLKWKPVLNIEDTIKMISDWYKNKKDYYNFTLSQIKEYESLI